MCSDGFPNTTLLCCSADIMELKEKKCRLATVHVYIPGIFLSRPSSSDSSVDSVTDFSAFVEVPSRVHTRSVR